MSADAGAGAGTARLVAISVGRAAPLPGTAGIDGAPVSSGIVKHPVSTLEAPVRVAVGPLGVAGDEQVDLTVHGGPERAVYLYPEHHYAYWRSAYAQGGHTEPLPWGALGENFTIAGIDEQSLWVGDELRIGALRLRVTQPRGPCYKLDARLGLPWAARMMTQSGYTGCYCAVVHPAEVAAGDPVLIVAGDRAVTVGEVHRMKLRRRPAAR